MPAGQRSLSMGVATAVRAPPPVCGWTPGCRRRPTGSRGAVQVTAGHAIDEHGAAVRAGLASAPHRARHGPVPQSPGPGHRPSLGLCHPGHQGLSRQPGPVAGRRGGLLRAVVDRAAADPDRDRAVPRRRAERFAVDAGPLPFSPVQVPVTPATVAVSVSPCIHWLRFGRIDCTRYSSASRSRERARSRSW